MCVFFRRPNSHRPMTYHHRQLLLMKDKPRRAVREPADVFEGFSYRAAGLRHKLPVKRAVHGTNPNEDETFGRLRLKRRIGFAVSHIADEKPGRLSTCRSLSCGRASLSEPRFGRCEEPIALQTPAVCRDGRVALQVRRGKGANPRERIAGGFSNPLAGAGRLAARSRRSAQAFTR